MDLETLPTKEAAAETEAWNGEDRFDDYPGIDLWKVIGDRRAIRYFLPYRPVERWKIEMTDQDKAVYHGIAGDVLSQLGYEA